MASEGSPPPAHGSHPASRVAIGAVVAAVVLALSYQLWPSSTGVLAGIAIPTVALLLVGPVLRGRPSAAAARGELRPSGPPPTLDERAGRARAAGSFERALQLWQQAARSRPDDPAPWLAMVDCVITDSGDLDRAHRVLRRGLGQLPDRARREQLVSGYLESLGPLLLDERERAEERERAWRWVGDESGPGIPLPAETRRVVPLGVDPPSR